MLFRAGFVGRQVVGGGGARSQAPTIDLGLLGPTLDPSITFIRNTGGTYFDSTGTLQTAGPNVPRFDYDPDTLMPLGLLMEIARTNIILNPRGEGAVAGTPGTDPTGWNTNNAFGATRTITPNTERGMPCTDIRIAGTTTAGNWNLTFSGASTGGLPVTASSIYTFSIYMAFIAGTFAGVSNVNLRFNQYDSGGVNLGALVSTVFPMSLFVIGDSVAKNRITFVMPVLAATTAFIQPFLQIAIAAGPTDVTLRVGPLQVELGSQVTSVILPPVGAPAATLRGTDSAFIDNAPSINLLTNTLMSETIVGYGALPAGSGLASIELDDKTTANTYTLRNSSPGTTNAVVAFSANVGLGGGGFASFTPNMIMKQAASFDGASFVTHAVQNGSAVVPYTFSGNPLALSRLTIAGGRTAPLTGWIRHVSYWPRILPDTELQQMTTLSTGPSLDLSLTGPNLPAALTLTRASTGTYVDATGTIQYAAINAPRYGYDPSSHTPLGLLIEEARTNLCIQSNDWSSWSTSPAASVLATANAAVSPDGTMNATSVVTNDTITSSHLIYRTYVGAVSSTFVASVYVKADAYPRVSIYLTGTGMPAGNNGVLFDLTTGSVVTTNGGPTVTIIPFPNGWYRVSVTTVSLSTSGTYILGICPAPATVSIVGQNYTPSSTGLGIFTWGAQIETATFLSAPTSYIPTTTATVTRSADLCSMPIGPWYNTAQGTLVVDGTMQQVFGGNQDIVGFDDGTINNGYITRCAANFFAVVGVSGGTGQPSATTANTITPGVPFKAGMTYNGGVLTGSLNGGAVVTASGTAPVTISRLNLGPIRQAAQNGFKSRIRYWPRVLSDAELQETTT